MTPFEKEITQAIWFFGTLFITLSIVSSVGFIAVFNRIANKIDKLEIL